MRPERTQEARLFRLVILAILILIFISVAISKIWELRIAAERVGVLQTLGSLRSAVGIKVSELVIHDGITAIGKLHHSNPMQLWSPPPINYLGEFSTSDAPLEPGIWYFDTDQKLLVYRVRFIDYFSSDNLQYPNLARYQLRLNYRDSNNNQQFDPYIDEPKGLFLQPLDSYRWLIEPEQQ